VPNGPTLTPSRPRGKAGQRPEAPEPHQDPATATTAMPGLAVAATLDSSAVRRAGAADADPLGGGPIPQGVLATLRQRRGGGQPLPPGPASLIGEQLGPVASTARIHTDAESDRLARSVQSVAFSYGSDVYFSSGSYAPDTPSGQHLLAHELSHVAQGSSSGGGAVVGRADDPAEHEADRSADRVLQALRRQAARLTTATDGADQASGAGPDGAVRRTAAQDEVVRRVYTLGERPSILGLPQVGGVMASLTMLEQHNWSRDDTVALANAVPAPSFVELNTIMGAFTAANARTILPLCANCTELAALAATGWPVAEFTRFAQLNPAPTFGQLRGTAAFFSPAEATTALLICGGWPDMLTLAGLGWPAADVARLAGGAVRPTVPQLQAAAAFFTPLQVDTVLPICAGGWADVLMLAGLGWPAADVARFAALGAAPTPVQLQAAAAFFAPGQIDTVLPICPGGWADVLVLAGLGWPAADVARFAGAGVRPTLAQLQAVAALFAPGQVDTVIPICGGWADVVTLAGSGWAADDLAYYAGVNPAPTFAELNAVATHFTVDQTDDLAGLGGFAWDDLAALANAAPGGHQSPAVTLLNAINACAQLVAEDLQQLATLHLNVPAARYQALLVGTNSLSDIDGMIVRDYLQDARWFSICFDTAQRLIDDLGNVPSFGSGGAQNATYALAQQQIRSGQLVGHLNAATVAPGPVMFNIHVGGHGFTLTVIGNQVHQLEAFASQASPPHEDPGVLARGEDLRMSLLTSIGANHTYPIATVTTAITQMTSNNPVHRAAGANTMGWNAGPCGFLAGGLIADPMAIWWQSASLHDNAQIVVNIAQRIHRQRVEIRQKLGLPPV